MQRIGTPYRLRWHSKEYLPMQLQKKSKWLMKSWNISVGDLVLMLNENTPRSVWPLGLVISTNVGRDGLIRSVCLKTKSSEFVRPITKLVFSEVFGPDAVGLLLLCLLLMTIHYNELAILYLNYVTHY